MVSSLNQVRHLYVANTLVENTPSAAGDIMVKASGANTGAIDKELYFLVKAYDTVLKSDRIPVKSIVYAKAQLASAMKVYMKEVTVSLSDDVNDGTPIVGQDYILRINLRQFYGMSDQDQYFKDAAVHVTKGMDAAAFYTEMVKALNLCFSREIGATKDSNPYLKFTATSDGITITEVPQDYITGIRAQERVYFDVVPTTVYCDGEDVIWSTPTVGKSATEYSGNGPRIADLEYFLLGERGDQYRKIGWPNDVETKGLVDASKEYDVLDIHYSFADSGVNSYKTEKDITIVSPSGSGVINAIVDKINSLTVLSIENATEAVGTSETAGKAVATAEVVEGKAVVDSVAEGATVTDTAEAVATPDTVEEKATVDTTTEAVNVAETAEEKPVVDATDGTTTEATAEGTETITA